MIIFEIIEFVLANVTELIIFSGRCVAKKVAQKFLSAAGASCSQRSCWLLFGVPYSSGRDNRVVPTCAEFTDNLSKYDRSALQLG